MCYPYWLAKATEANGTVRYTSIATSTQERNLSPALRVQKYYKPGTMPSSSELALLDQFHKQLADWYNDVQYLTGKDPFTTLSTELELAHNIHKNPFDNDLKKAEDNLEIDMGLVALLDFTKGTFSAEAALTSGSFIFTKYYKLRGGFALCYRLGGSGHEGD